LTRGDLMLMLDDLHTGEHPHRENAGRPSMGNAGWKGPREIGVENRAGGGRPKRRGARILWRRGVDASGVTATTTAGRSQVLAPAPFHHAMAGAADAGA